MKVKRTERGWGGHFICGHACRFRRNTLLSAGRRYSIVSTVGNYVCEALHNTEMQAIGAGIKTSRYYETMIFVGVQVGPYIDADVRQEISPVQHGIYAKDAASLPEDVDNLANDMHEKNVAWVMQNFEELYAHSAKHVTN